MHRQWVQGVLKQDKPSCYNAQTMITGCPETGQTFMLQCTDNEYRVSWNRANLHVTMHRQWVQGVLKQEKPSCYNAQTMSTGCPETGQTFMLQCTDNEYRVSWNKTNLHVTMHRQWVQGVLKQDKPSCYNAQTMSTGCPETRQTFMLQCTDNEYRVSWNKAWHEEVTEILGFSTCVLTDAMFNVIWHWRYSDPYFSKNTGKTSRSEGNIRVCCQILAPAICFLH